MNVSRPQGDSTQTAAAVSGWLYAVLACAVCAAAISRQSLWIDEALTATKAVQSSFTAWWQAMQADKASDLQMPLYMIYAWGFAKILGTSEAALRAANAPWFIVGMVAMVRALPRRLALGATAAAFTSSFVWYYLDEARPYTMQLGASMLIFAALFRLSRHDPVAPADSAVAARWIAAFLVGIVALSGSSLLGMIWAGAAYLSLPILFNMRQLRETARANIVKLAVASGALLCLAVYYLWTIKVGARASDAGSTDARNILFIAYELLGFGGLGPGRLSLRENGLKSFGPYLPQLALFGIAMAAVLGAGVRDLLRGKSRRVLAAVMVAVVLPACLILGAGVAMRFRVLGRHFMPMTVVVILTAGAGLRSLWSGRWFSKTVVLIFLVTGMAACLSIRLAERHRKDDYRGAAMFANAVLHSGKTVWWNAGREGGEYYQVPLGDSTAGGKAEWLMNPSLDLLKRLPAADLVVESKPDIYDVAGAVGGFLESGHYEKVVSLPAFTIWRRATTVPVSPAK